MINFYCPFGPPPLILSLACDTILILSQEALFCYPHHFRLLYSPQHSWGIRLFIYEAARSELVLEERAVTYECDAKGTALNYEAIGEAITTVRCNARLDRSWKEKIEEDHRKRGKKTESSTTSQNNQNTHPGNPNSRGFSMPKCIRFFKIKVFIPLHIC